MSSYQGKRIKVFVKKPYLALIPKSTLSSRRYHHFPPLFPYFSCTYRKTWWFFKIHQYTI